MDAWLISISCDETWYVYLVGCDAAFYAEAWLAGFASEFMQAVSPLSEMIGEGSWTARRNACGIDSPVAVTTFQESILLICALTCAPGIVTKYCAT